MLFNRAFFPYMAKRRDENSFGLTWGVDQRISLAYQRESL